MGYSSTLENTPVGKHMLGKTANKVSPALHPKRKR